jgi:hypothetical protein
VVCWGPGTNFDQQVQYVECDEIAFLIIRIFFLQEKARTRASIAWVTAQAVVSAEASELSLQTMMGSKPTLSSPSSLLSQTPATLLL